MKKLLPLLLLGLIAFGNYAQAQSREILRGDANVEFKWRFGYGEYPMDSNSPIQLDDAERGTFGWYDGYLWAVGYPSWQGDLLHGANLLFRGGSPYARSVRCTSEIVPFDRSGQPVTFALPMHYTLGSEERISLSLRIVGQTDETVVLNLTPQRLTSTIGGMLKAQFFALSASQPETDKPLVRVTGMLHIRVYPRLLNYGGRMLFEFNSSTSHQDVETSMMIGSLWKDVSQTNIESAFSASKLTDTKLLAMATTHRSRLETWSTTSKQASEQLLQTGEILVESASKGERWDRGELRTQAYSGNPVKDFQFGPLTGRIEAMATALSKEMGQPFSIFRYQHHRLPWNEKDPQQMNPLETPYLDQWLRAANLSADTVVLDLQLSPIVKAYKAFSQMGTRPLPDEGIPNYPWQQLVEGYTTTLRHALSICPKLRIVQMPYEIDNIASTECHQDAHYRFFRSLYQAVARINQELPTERRLAVAGLGINNPHHRWAFIDGFLRRYAQDPDPDKRLDYATWHAYLFPGDSPNTAVGINRQWLSLLNKNKIDRNSVRILIDESGLAEPSTIEDLSDLLGAARKEAAMACFSASIHDWYIKEKANILAISGGGWHFGLLCYGLQNALSPYAKGMKLRSLLHDQTIKSRATPCDDKGYGLYSFATRQGNSLRILVWSASPAIFFKDALPLRYPQSSVRLTQLPKALDGKELNVTVRYSHPEEPRIRKILAQNKCQTFPLTRGADRYDIDFTPQEVEELNRISSYTQTVRCIKGELRLSLPMEEYGMYLIEVEY